MEDWKQKFGLIGLRHLALKDQPQGNVYYLTAEVVIDAETYQNLPPWDKAAARACAVGMTVDVAVISGQAAARLRGLQVLEIESHVVCYLPGAKVPSSKKKWTKGVVYRSGYLRESDIETFQGMRITSLICTFLDIARYDGLDAAVVVIDSARRRWPELTKERLLEEANPFRGRAGLKVLKSAIALSVHCSDSAQETKARLLIQKARIPEIKRLLLQAPFDRPEIGTFYLVDILINNKIIVEIDGRVKYQRNSAARTEEVIIAEREREKYLSNLGYIVLRITPKQLEERTGESEFIRLLRQHLESRM